MNQDRRRRTDLDVRACEIDYVYIRHLNISIAFLYTCWLSLVNFICLFKKIKKTWPERFSDISVYMLNVIDCILYLHLLSLNAALYSPGWLPVFIVVLQLLAKLGCPSLVRTAGTESAEESVDFRCKLFEVFIARHVILFTRSMYDSLGRMLFAYINHFISS